MEGNPHLRVTLPNDVLHMCQVDKTKPAQTENTRYSKPSLGLGKKIYGK